MSLSTLPDELIKLLMQHVTLKDRLTTCCLVNRSLHATAVAATDVVMLPFSNMDKLTKCFQ